jgi:hypothetical protein
VENIGTQYQYNQIHWVIPYEFFMFFMTAITGAPKIGFT